MLVMAVVVTMTVCVRDPLVIVEVDVPVGEEQRDASGHEDGAPDVCNGQVLAEDKPRDHSAEEGRRREEHLGSRRADLLRRRDIEREGDAVA